MTEIIVKTQAELDAALARDDISRNTHEIIIDSPAGVWITIGDDNGQDVRVQAYGSATVQAYGSATVRAYGSATVRASGSATVEASDSATVLAYGSATVEAYGSATVQAYGSATVRAYGSATVRASGSATVQASDSATVRAAPYVAVHLLSAHATVSGGVVIDIAALDQNDPRTWCELHGVTIDNEGNAHLYKAVDDNFTAGHSWTPTVYTLGSDPRCDEWLDNNDCGGGLHVCPTAWHARNHYSDATSYLEVTAPLTSIRPIDATKCKAPTVHVLREVDLDMRPVREAADE